MRRFWIALRIVTVVSHLPLAFGLAVVLGRLGVIHGTWIALAVVVPLVALLSGRLMRFRMEAPLPRWRRLLIEEPYYAHWCGSLGSLLFFVISGLAVSIRALVVPSASFVSDLGTAALASYGAAFAFAAYGVVVRRRWVRVRTLDVAIPGLGPAFEGYRIAQLSDLHIGSFNPRSHGERWARKLRELDADLVVLTGDYVTSGVTFHADIAAVLSTMRGRDGVIAVMGNHDYFGDGEPLITMLRAGGVEVLRNENRELSRGADRITIAGIDDTWTRRADVARTLAGRDPSLPMLVLAHDPQLFPKFAEAGAALVLSGHTHWGQIAVPFLATRFNLSRLSYRFHAGKYEIGGSTLYINPGIGTTGPPVRLGAPPEITVLRLHRA